MRKFISFILWYVYSGALPFNNIYKQSDDAKNSYFAQYSTVRNGTAVIATWTTKKITNQEKTDRHR
jgi:hypothetical protein